MLKFEVCSSKTLCFRQYLVKADRNENLSKTKSLRWMQLIDMSWHIVMAPTVVRVDVILKWKLASWKVKGKAFAPPLPESLDEMKDWIRLAIASVTTPLLQRVRGNLQGRLVITIKNKGRHFVKLWLFYFSCWIIKFQLELRFCLSTNCKQLNNPPD